MNVYLIAKKLSHSFSKPIHNELADYSYDLCELREDEIGEFVKNGGYDAFNVTIPYKKDEGHKTFRFFMNENYLEAVTPVM